MAKKKTSKSKIKKTSKASKPSKSSKSPKPVKKTNAKKSKETIKEEKLDPRLEENLQILRTYGLPEIYINKVKDIIQKE